MNLNEVRIRKNKADHTSKRFTLEILCTYANGEDHAIQLARTLAQVAGTIGPILASDPTLIEGPANECDCALCNASNLVNNNNTYHHHAPHI